MSQTLQLLLPDEEMNEIRRSAESQQLSVEDWAREALRRAHSSHSDTRAEAKFRAIRRAVSHSFPTADIEQMNAEIEQGYLK
jgi:hypothetical protein